MIYPIPADAITDKFMPDFERMAQAGHGEMSARGIMRNAKQGVYTVALYGDPAGDHCLLALTTEVIENDKILTVVGAVGTMNVVDDHESVWDALESTAKRNGCNRVRFVGRRGFSRALRRSGWEELHTIFERKVV